MNKKHETFEKYYPCHFDPFGLVRVNSGEIFVQTEGRDLKDSSSSHSSE